MVPTQDLTPKPWLVMTREGEHFTTGSSSVLRGGMKNPRRFLRDYKPAQFYFCNFCNSREKQTDSEGNLKINTTLAQLVASVA